MLDIDPIPLSWQQTGEREETVPSTFVLSDGSLSYSFEVHATTGLVEVL